MIKSIITTKTPSPSNDNLVIEEKGASFNFNFFNVFCFVFFNLFLHCNLEIDKYSIRKDKEENNFFLNKLNS